VWSIIRPVISVIVIGLGIAVASSLTALGIGFNTTAAITLVVVPLALVMPIYLWVRHIKRHDDREIAEGIAAYRADQASEQIEADARWQAALARSFH
jgi:hypothetical protein